MDLAYFLRWKGGVTGPFTPDHVRGLISAGKISRFHEISPDQRSWRPLAELPELMPKPVPASVVAAAAIKPVKERALTPRSASQQDLSDAGQDTSTYAGQGDDGNVRRNVRKNQNQPPDHEDDAGGRTLPRVRRVSTENETVERGTPWPVAGESAFCTSCGKPIMLGAVICPKCGVPTNNRTAAVPWANSLAHAALENTSGRPCAPSELPEEARKLSWGAFWFTWIWGLCNGVPLALISLLLPIVFNFVLLFKGREWAWEGKRWDSEEHFARVQYAWGLWGAILVGIATLMWLLLVLIIVLAAGETAAS